MRRMACAFTVPLCDSYFFTRGSSNTLNTLPLEDCSIPAIQTSSIAIYRVLGLFSLFFAEISALNANGVDLGQLLSCILQVLIWMNSVFQGANHNQRLTVEPCHETMVLFVLRKLILQTRMRSHPLGLDVWLEPLSSSIPHVCEQQILWRNCADAQVCLCLRWSPMW